MKARWLCVAHEKEIPGFRDFAPGIWIPQVLGVGQFASLAELARLTALQRPEGIVLAGTCGALNREDTFRLFQCQHFSFPQIGEEDLPEFLPRAVEATEAVATTLPRATVLQNHGISLSAEKFRSNTGYIPPGYPQPIVENMEAASLAVHCSNLKIPFTALLCATNQIGSAGRAEWSRNFRRAGELLASALEALV